jgi:DNA-binding transcriptional LysR family regulator
LELKWLEDFVSLAGAASFSRAAKARNITQPGFSRRIKALEGWVGAELIDRSVSPSVLTPAGARFLDTATRVVDDLNGVRDRLRSQERQEAATLVFGALHSLSLGFFPRWLRSVEARTGPVRSRLVADNRTLDGYLSALADGECDFLLTYSHPAVPVLADDPMYERRIVGIDRLLPMSGTGPDGRPLFVLPGRPGHPLPLLRSSSGSFIGRCLAGVGEGWPVLHLETVYENAMVEGLKAMVVAGFGIAWLPESGLSDEIAAGTVARAGDQRFTIDVAITVYRSRAAARPAARRFWAALDPQSRRGAFSPSG